MEDVGIADLKTAAWIPTLKLTVYRWIASGIVWAVIGEFGKPPADGFLTPIAIGLLAVPLLVGPITLALSLITAPLARAGIPFIGLLSLPAMAFSVPGDPILWIVERLRPGTLPISNLRIFNMVGFILVTKPDAFDTEERVKEVDHLPLRPSADRSYCSHCGFRPTRSDARFCTRCGVVLQ